MQLALWIQDRLCYGTNKSTFAGRQVEYGPLVELSAQDALALIRIANGGDVDGDNIAESSVTRLQSLGLVEQRGVSFGLTLKGMHSVAWLRHS